MQPRRFAQAVCPGEAARAIPAPRRCQRLPAHRPAACNGSDGQGEEPGMLRLAAVGLASAALATSLQLAPAHAMDLDALQRQLSATYEQLSGKSCMRQDTPARGPCAPAVGGCRVLLPLSLLPTWPGTHPFRRHRQQPAAAARRRLRRAAQGSACGAAAPRARRLGCRPERAVRAVQG